MIARHSEVATDGARLVATALPVRSHLVRVHPAGDGGYDRMIVVTEMDEGRTLFLSGWIGPPLTRAQWREAASALFPAAETVRFERMNPDGTFRSIILSLGADEFHRRPSRN